MTNLALKIPADEALGFDYSMLGDPEIEKLARRAVKRIKTLQRDAIISIGRELTVVKAALGHGHFLRWLKAEFPWDRRTASNMMQVFEAFGSQWESVSHLPTTILYKLAAPSTPPEVVAEFTGQSPRRIVSPATLRQMIGDAKRRLSVEEAAEQAIDRQKQCDVTTITPENQKAIQTPTDKAMLIASSLRQWLGPNFAKFQDMLADIEVDMLHQALEKMRHPR